MKKIKTAFFWKNVLFTAAGYLILSVLLNLFLNENFGSEFWVEVLFEAVSFGSLMSFCFKQKFIRITDSNEVK